ncbi:MAG: phosphopyruvate hydratase [Candidatus Norongarragalinales archaeon]
MKASPKELKRIRVRVKKIFAREVLDSRGNPTIEVVLNGRRALVPSGASAGAHEAQELRDGGKRFGGKGVLRAVNNVNTVIKRRVVGKFFTQEEFDAALIRLDGTRNKKRLGANAIVGASIAFSRAAAAQAGLPSRLFYSALFGSTGKKLPCPVANLINGGVHAGNDLSIQEFLVLPVRAKTFEAATVAICETRLALRNALRAKYGAGATNVGDEGGFAPPCAEQEEPLDLLVAAVDESGHSKEIVLGIDAAATQFYNAKKHNYLLGSETLSRSQLNDYYARLAARYPLTYIEDPFEEEAFEDFARLRRRLPNILIVGDDLCVTNPARIALAVKRKACNAVIIKANQIGTISETLDACRLARDAGLKLVVSHRSGETEDAFIADFAVGIDADFIKLGAPCRSERTAKYNKLLRIESRLK